MIILIHIQFQALSIVEKSLSAWELTRDLGRKSQVDQRSLVTIILIPFDHSLSLLLKIFNLFDFL